MKEADDVKQSKTRKPKELKTMSRYRPMEDECSLSEIIEGDYDVVLLDPFESEEDIIKAMKKLRPTLRDADISTAVRNSPVVLFEDVTGEEVDEVRHKLFKAGGRWQIRANSRVGVYESKDPNFLNN